MCGRGWFVWVVRLDNVLRWCVCRCGWVIWSNVDARRRGFVCEWVCLGDVVRSHIVEGSGV